MSSETEPANETCQHSDETEMPGDRVSLSVEGLHFSYGEYPILKGVDIRLDEPALVSIIGPNGVGKSTLVQCINKILKPTEGVVYLNGQDVQGISLKELAQHMGYVPCITNGTFPITVIDTVLMGRHPHSRRGTFDKDLKIAYDTLDMLGISDLAMRQITELSAGQHQKVMLAKGLAQQPKILILDEPTANLDIKHQMVVTRMLRDISRKQKMFVLMICHDLNIAAKYSDRIIMMAEGKIYSEGTPEEVITPENIKHVYDVDCKVIIDEGRPHMIVHDES